MTKSDLHPGDCLLYAPKGFWSWGTLICIKTFSSVSHCELYVGRDTSVGARDGRGVNSYPFMAERLKYVVRPPRPVDVLKLVRWHETVKGTPYGWMDLLGFYNIGADDPGMICSEYCTLAYRRLGIEFFRPDYPARKVSPGMFLSSPVGILFTWSEA